MQCDVVSLDINSEPAKTTSSISIHNQFSLPNKPSVTSLPRPTVIRALGVTDEKQLKQSQNIWAYLWVVLDFLGSNPSRKECFTFPKAWSCRKLRRTSYSQIEAPEKFLLHPCN